MEKPRKKQEKPRKTKENIHLPVCSHFYYVWSHTRMNMNKPRELSKPSRDLKNLRRTKLLGTICLEKPEKINDYFHVSV